MSQSRVELSNHPGVSKVAIGGWGAVLFGLPFAAAGTCIALVAADVIEVDPSSIHAPRWVLGAIGGLFGFVGLMLMVHGLVGKWRTRRLQARAALHPDEPWYADHFWDPHGGVDHSSHGAQGVFGTVVVVMFAAVFHGVQSEMGSWSWLIVGVLDLLAAWCIIYTVYTMIRGLKYGRTRIRWDRFPFFLGERIEVTFVTPERIRDFRTLTFTLRQVEEAYETRGHGKNRSTQVVCYQRHHDSFELKEGVDLPRKVTEIPVVFDLPETAFPSRIAARPAHFWELEIGADAPGVDFRARFLLPVYARPGTETPVEPVPAESELAGV